MRPVTGAGAATCLALAWSAVDRAVRDAAGGEPWLHVGYRAGTVWSADAANHEAMFVSERGCPNPAFPNASTQHPMQTLVMDFAVFVRVVDNVVK